MQIGQHSNPEPIQRFRQTKKPDIHPLDVQRFILFLDKWPESAARKVAGGTPRGFAPWTPTRGVTGFHIVAHCGALCMETDLRRF